MEKSLLEKMKNGTCDDIDKDMIASRMMRALKDMVSAMSSFGDTIQALQEKYSEELELMDFGLVVGMTEFTDKADDIEFKCIVGKYSSVVKCLKKMTETVIKGGK